MTRHLKTDFENLKTCQEGDGRLHRRGDLHQRSCDLARARSRRLTQEKMTVWQNLFDEGAEQGQRRLAARASSIS